MMALSIAQSLPYGVAALQILLVLVLLAVIFRQSWGRGIVSWINRHALKLGLLLALMAVAGSLFYSNVVGFVPCDLCWWQRIFIYPQLVLFLTALKFKDLGVFKYSWRLAVLGAIVAIYHEYIQIGGHSPLPCSVTGACEKLYVYAFNYMTIPIMSLTICLGLLLLAYINKKHE